MRKLHPFVTFGAVTALVVAVVLLAWPGAAPSDPSGLVGPTTRGEPGRGERVAGLDPIDGGRAPAPPKPVARPGGKVHGTVRWDYGGAVGGAEVTLLDESGEVVDEVVTDDSGTYALADGDLTGAELRVTEPYGSAHQRDLAALAPGENRAFDVVLGDEREVVGWVLDGVGDPQPGVVVTLSWESADSHWRAVTDAGGGFTFVDVPASPLRVSADGGDLGLASARVARTEATRREVTLVLEPVGTILVSASPEVVKLGEVTVRCFSAAAHGEDGLWNDDLRPVEVVTNGELAGDGIDPTNEVPEGETPAEPVPTVDEVPAEDMQPEPSLPEIETMLGNALRGWDHSDPKGSLVAMALEMARSNAHMEQELRRDMGRQDPAMAQASLEELARMAAEKVIAEEPRVLDMMGLAAQKIQEGVAPMEAFMAAEQESRQNQPEVPAAANSDGANAEAEAQDESQAVPDDGTYTETPPEELTENPRGVEFDPGAEYVGAEAYAGDDAYQQFSQRVDELRERTGIDTIEAYGEPRSIVTTGRFFDPIPVRGAFEYQVSVRAPDGLEIICGTVFVAPGEEVEVTCGGTGPAILEGRVIDTAGKPVAGALIDVYAGDVFSTTSDTQGRYVLEVTTSGAQLLTVSASDPGGQLWSAQRRQQNARPGLRTEVPDLVARMADESPVHSMTEPFGGVGANIELGNEGIVLAGLFDDGPLAMAGVEPGDVIVRIGEELGASLSTDDALLLLRGEVGSDVDLTLRSAAGELYELMVTRGLVNPVAEPDYE